MGIIFSKEEFQEELLKINPFSKIEVLDYSGFAYPVKIKCLECGKIISFDNVNKAKTKINLCSEKHFYSCKQKAEFLLKQLQLEILEWNSEKKGYAKIKCLICEEIFFRQHTHLIANPNHCPACRTASNKQSLDIIQAQKTIDEIFGLNKYQLLKYKTYHEKALFKHECGFSWSGRYDSFLKSKGCPKCYKNQSKGEIKIADWLSKHNINFIQQFSLKKPYQR